MMLRCCGVRLGAGVVNRNDPPLQPSKSPIEAQQCFELAAIVNIQYCTNIACSYFKRDQPFLSDEEPRQVLGRRADIDRAVLSALVLHE